MPRKENYDRREALEEIQEEAKLTSLLREFKNEQLSRLFRKVHEGFRGWDSPEIKSILIKMLSNKVNLVLKGEAEPKDYVDIANVSMFLWNLNEEEEE